MAGTETYHEISQSHRVQKRLALNQCFRALSERCGSLESATYITFGGAELCDVLDLVCASDVLRKRLTVVSYEQDSEVVQRARSCHVARALLQFKTVSIVIVNSPFFDQATQIQNVRNEGRCIYFIDDTRPFSRSMAAKIGELLAAGLLRTGDFFMVTSCLTPRVLHQPKFMRADEQAFKMFYGADCVLDREFKVRNHVELLLGVTFSAHDRVAAQTGLPPLRSVLMRKFRYNDTRAAMGLWLFEIVTATSRMVRLKDSPFEPFPWIHDEELSEPAGVPDIFDYLD